MGQSLLLFLSANRLHAQFMAGGRVLKASYFVDTEDGLKSFSSFLQTARFKTYLLTDLIEEDFRHEIVPHLIGNSKRLLLQRKFDQFYRSTPFHQATLLQRQKNGRRDDDMLFSALTNPSLIMPWLNILMEQKIPLAGIYSVPQISAPLIEGHQSSHLLLISWEKHAGLRQTYFSEHHLQISRLTPVHAQQTFHKAVSSELARTYQYLKSLSLLPAGQILDVHILCHRNDRAKLEAEGLHNDADIHYDSTDISDLAKRLDIEHEFTDSDATQLFLHQLAAHPPRTHYADEIHTHYFSLWRFKHALNIASGILLLCAFLWGAANFWLNNNAATKTSLLKARTNQTQDELQQILNSFPNTYAPAADMKTGVRIEHRLKLYTPDPTTILAPISVILARHPQVELDDIAWIISASEPVMPDTRADVPAAVVTLKGRLLNFATDYRAALGYLDRLHKDFVQQGYQVTTLEEPLDVSPTGSISDQREDAHNVLGFSLQISKRPSI